MLSILIIIYIAFISLGLPDSMLGTAWPMMYPDLGVPVSWAGIIAATVCGGTVLSSLLYARISRRFSTICITSASVAMTAAALLLFSAASSFPFLLAIALLLGLGAGSVDTALNNYVALHYKARAMNFLHAFWGIGTLIGPVILSVFFAHGISWRTGYRTLGAMQGIVCLILILSAPLWRKAGRSSITADGNEPAFTEAAEDIGIIAALSRPGAVAAVMGFFAYSALEQTSMLWAATFLVEARGFSEGNAAAYAGLLFWGITSGRIISGLIATHMESRNLIRCGQAVVLIGILTLLAIPEAATGAALFLIGMGFGPIYPTMLHQTPEYFGAAASSRIMALEMVAAYIGSAFMPAAFGIIGRNVSMSLFPAYILFFVLLNTLMVEIKRARRFGIRSC